MPRGQGRRAAHRHTTQERIVQAVRRVLSVSEKAPTTRDIGAALRAEGFLPRNLTSTLRKARGVVALRHQPGEPYRWTLAKTTKH